MTANFIAGALLAAFMFIFLWFIFTSPSTVPVQAEIKPTVTILSHTEGEVNKHHRYYHIDLQNSGFDLRSFEVKVDLFDSQGHILTSGSDVVFDLPKYAQSSAKVVCDNPPGVASYRTYIGTVNPVY